MTVAQYPRLPINLHSLPEWNRRGADAINYLLGRVQNLDAYTGIPEEGPGETSLTDVIRLMYELSIEEAIMRGSTTWSAGNQLINYTDTWSPTPADGFTKDITFDPVAGEITAGVAGIYRLSGYVLQTGGTGTNTEYATFLTTSLGGQLALGAISWNNQAVGLVHYASVIAQLAAGETIAIQTNNTSLVVGESYIHAQLESLDLFA